MTVGQHISTSKNAHSSQRSSIAHQVWDSFLASIRQGRDMQQMLNQYH